MQREVVLMADTPYVEGVVGHIFRPSIKERIKILFCKEIHVVLVENRMPKEITEEI